MLYLYSLETGFIRKSIVPGDEFDLNTYGAIQSAVDLGELFDLQSMRPRYKAAPLPTPGGELAVFDVVDADFNLWPDPALSPEELENRRVQAIRTQAGFVITSLLPDWKQRNFLARFNELLEKRLEGLTLSSSEQSEVEAMKSYWFWVKQVRETSDQAEAAMLQVGDIIWPEYLP